DVINDAQTIFWNGPLGLYEITAFAQGTKEIIKAVATSAALSIVGGGDTIAALNQLGSFKEMGFVSSGGGASLELLEGKKLPGLMALGYYA
ncbi:MAG TPA: phosphoglycerate kinase, partial [Myxococcota bacterium]|nr:phosphoglycerate kinase [Myxococcota bacterium]